MGNQGSAFCEDATAAVSQQYIEDAAGRAHRSAASNYRRRGGKCQLVSQYTCFTQVPEPLECREEFHQQFSDLHVLEIRASDAVSPSMPLRSVWDDEYLRFADQDNCGSSTSCRDPVVQNLIEAFQRCTSREHKFGSRWSLESDASTTADSLLPDSVDRLAYAVHASSWSMSRSDQGSEEDDHLRLPSWTAADAKPFGPHRRNLLSASSDDGHEEVVRPAARVATREKSIGGERSELGELCLVYDHMPNQLQPPELGLRSRIFGPEEAEGGDLHGFGVLTWEDGRRYEGEFENGILQGQACMTWPDGRTYTGQYEQNRKHGVGVFSWPDGRRYSGNWSQGLREGRGVYTNARGETRHGLWQEDRPLAWDMPSEKRQAPLARQMARAGGA